MSRIMTREDARAALANLPDDLRLFEAYIDIEHPDNVRDDIKFVATVYDYARANKISTAAVSKVLYLIRHIREREAFARSQETT